MKRTLLILSALTITGCGTLGLSPDARRTEIVWQTMNIADGVQTSQYRVNDCKEVGAWRTITGPEPSVGSTVLAASINAGLHYLVTWALERYEAPKGVRRTWAFTTIGATAGQVAYNASLKCAR